MKKDIHPILLPVLLIGSMLVYYFPFIVLGEHSFIKIHDNLDSFFVWDYLIANRHNDGYFQNDSYLNIMNGLSASHIGSSWNIVHLFFKLFPPLVAYLLNDLFARVAGFIGMILLLGDHVIPSKTRTSRMAICLSAVLFSFVGTYTIYSGLTVLGQPLLLWIMWHLYKGTYQWWYFLLIVGFAFASSFVLSGLFILFALAIWWLYGCIKDKNIRFPFLMALFLLSVSYVFVEHKMFYDFLFAVDPSHRIEFVKEPLSLWMNIKFAIIGFLSTHYHAGFFYTIPVVVLTGIVFLLRKGKSDRFSGIFLFIISIICCWSFIYILLRDAFGRNISILSAFNWERFYFLLPTCWVLLFAVGISWLFNHPGWKYKFTGIFFVVIMFANVCFYNTELRQSYEKLAGKSLPEPCFDEFFDPSLFSSVHAFIGKSPASYRVVSVGMHPSVALYNGFYCLDGYQTLYPLSYKHTFRELIKEELERNVFIKNYFNHFGSRCYVFSSELTEEYGKPYFLYGHKDNARIENLYVDYSIFKEMGGEYLLSAVEIINHPKNVTLENIFDGLWWRIYLYKIE